MNKEITFPIYKKNGWGFVKVNGVRNFILVSSYYKEISLRDNPFTYIRIIDNDGFEDSTKEEFENEYLKTLELFSEAI